MTRTWIPSLLGGVLVLTAGAALAETQEDARPIDQLDRQLGWTTYRDGQQGLSLTLPPGWHRARRSFTPSLIEPREVLTVGSYRLHYKRRSRCLVPGCPLPALDGFGRGDVLISIQERRHVPRPVEAGSATASPVLARTHATALPARGPLALRQASAGPDDLDTICGQWARLLRPSLRSAARPRPPPAATRGMS
jgi:hypothetical protein